MDVKGQITGAVKKASGTSEIDLKIPENNLFGDYTTNVALVSAREKGENSKVVAVGLVKKLEANKNLSEICDKIEIAGPGFVNFWLKTDILIDTLKEIDISKSDFGKSDIGEGKTVIVDYSSPNIAKPFGIGHLRSTLIGQALYNLYKFLGYEVVGDNHLGDWGTQFGKLLYMIETENVKDFDIAKLEELYVKFHRLVEEDPSLDEKARRWFKKLEDGDSEAKKIWQKCVDVSMAEFDRIYEMLGVKIDFAFGESYSLSEMKQMLRDSEIKQHLTKGEGGAMVVDLSKEGIKTPLMILKSDGATTYATRDLATIKFRVRKWDPSMIIYEVGAEQSLHFQQVFAAARLLGLVKPSVELVHTSHGLYLAPDGKKFSTRKGKTVKLEEILNEAIERAEKLGGDSPSAKAVARQVGIGAVKYFDLMHSVKSDVVFDWEKMMNLEGNSGPYLQYTVARCNSVIEKASVQDRILNAVYSNLDSGEIAVLRSLAKFRDVIETSAKLYSPNLLCNYLYDLAQKYNSFYDKDKIIGGENEGFRLALTSGTAQVLKNGLKILGIDTPERM